MKQYNMIIGEKLRTLRENRGYSLEYVGNLVGKSRKTIHAYEMGVISISVDNLKALLEVYDYSAGKFLDEI